MSENNAVAIPRRHKYQCDICMLIDTEASKDMKWHIWKEGVTEEEDSVICNDCLEGIKDIRKKCHQKIDNPHHKVLDNYMPWFAKDVPGLVDKFVKERI